MLQLNREPGFVLKRSPYKENHYLVDLFTVSYGKIRANVRIGQQKTHRNTECYAPFRELLLSGHQKTELTTIWHSEIVQIFPISGHDWLSASYLNELLLHYPAHESDHALYRLYKNALNAPTTHLRQIEWHLIRELGLLPERKTSGQYYHLAFQPNKAPPLLIPAENGFPHQLIQALDENQLPLDHPQLKSYLQLLLQPYFGSLRSRQTALSLLRLLRS